MSARAHESPLLDAGVRIDHIPAEGRDIDVAADARQREVIAERLGISAVERLEANLSLSRFRGGMRVEGRVVATAVQPCVVTFVPVRQQIDEEIDRIFLPADEQPKPSAGHPEAFVDLDADDPPDYFEGHEVDLSDAIVESVALALDPYPRAPGVSLDDMALPPEEAEASPFASLKSLLDPDDKG
jgi:uncharacterized metal-binding protein YceD (DUF177 family)